MNARKKRQALAVLNAPRLRALIDTLSIDDAPKRSRQDLESALADGRRIDFELVLDTLTRDELRAMCTVLDLEPVGRTKNDLADRILQSGQRKAAPSQTSSKKRGSPKRPAGSRKPDKRKETPRKNKAPAPSKASQLSKTDTTYSKKSPRKTGEAQNQKNTRGVNRRKTVPEDFKQTLWKAADKLRAQMDAAEYKHIVLGLIFLKYISDTFVKQQDRVEEMVSEPSSDYFISEDPAEYKAELEERDYYTQDNVFWVPQEARWETLRSKAKQPDIGGLVDDAMTAIENENTSLRGKLDKRFGRAQLGQGVLGELIDLISTIGFTDKHDSTDLLGEVYEYFLGQFASAEGKKGGQFYTPAHVVKTLVAVLSPTTGRVYDPCCGSGGMFVQSEEFVKAHGGRVDDISIYGQESNPTTWRLAAMNLAIRGFSADLGKEPADTFARDQFPDVKFDYIMANPPFNISDWGGEKYENDPRWQFGRPPVGNANYAWLQHMLWKLRPGGQAGVVLANGSMSSNTGGEGQIREAMVRGDVVEVMVALPGQLFLNTQIPVCLWFLTNHKTMHGRNRRGETLFIDARQLGTMETRVLKVFTDEDIAKIQATVQSWKTGEGYEDVAGFCKSASLEEIEKNGFVLTPGRYVGTEETSMDTEAFTQKIKKLTESLHSLQDASSELDQRIVSTLSMFEDV